MESRNPRDEAIAQKMYYEAGKRNASLSVNTTAAPNFGSPKQTFLGYNMATPSPQKRAPYSTSPPRHCTGPLQSVVTTSFSHEEERDAPSDSRRTPSDHRVDSSPSSTKNGMNRESWARVERSQMHRAPSFPHPPRPLFPPLLRRGYSNPGEFHETQRLKRSFYHHSAVGARSGPEHPDFLPPKRLKGTGFPVSDTKQIVTPNSHDPSLGWIEGKTPPELREEEHMQRIARTHSMPGAWGDRFDPRSQHLPYPDGYPRTPVRYVAVSPPGGADDRRMWPQRSPTWETRSPPATARRFWNNNESTEQFERSRFPPGPSTLAYSDPRHAPPTTHSEIPKLGGNLPQSPALCQRSGSMDAIEEKESESTDSCSRDPPSLQSNHASLQDSEKSSIRSLGANEDGTFMLLSLPQDKVSLSETLCVVRENIEVFTATQADVDAPAPGRKHSVAVGQVGLRCVHCRQATKCSDKVKRAVCYPSSIKRIYRTVIDMKLDHFTQCKYVPSSLKQKLDELKAVQTRSTGTTMQYFIRAAHTLGMEDGDSGVSMRSASNLPPPFVQATHCHLSLDVSDSAKDAASLLAVKRVDSSSSSSSSSWSDSVEVPPLKKKSTANKKFEVEEPVEEFDANKQYFAGTVPLSMADDKTALSPLRCFLREQVCAFAATEEDIAVRAPTTFSIRVGQVGIGCVHCVRQPAKIRSNRAVCFPFSIGRIYQSVADIQRFHLGECKMLPVVLKEKFLQLQLASSKGSKGLATRQYWVTSAKSIGLVDTTQGIRFGRDPTRREEKISFSLDILAQAAFSVTTGSKQLVVPEDRSSIAEFLYEVMQQLQPCRFTEADRNKRRLKDVGCIGVECRHCAGQVDSRKFFWSSVNAVESNFVSVHTHMLECRMVPTETKEHLARLKKLRKEQTASLKSGSQKAFFARVWNRLHDDDHLGGPLSPSSLRQQKRQVKPKEIPVVEEESSHMEMQIDEEMEEEPVVAEMASV